MPCPYFEPQQIFRNGQDLPGRLPLFNEYNGQCHARDPIQPVLSAFRLAGCNQGQIDSGCTALPDGVSRFHRRFSAKVKTIGEELTIEVLVLEIKDYSPQRSYSVSYSKMDEKLVPEVQNSCERAQILAFCRSYLRRFLPCRES